MTIPDTVFRGLARLAAAAVPAALGAVAVVLAVEAAPALARAGELQLFTSAAWVPDPPAGGPPTFGSLAFLYGTAVTAGIALVLAVPVGIGAAAFLSDIAPPRVRRGGAVLVELLAAVPGVVYGLWGLKVLAPAVQRLSDAVGGPNTGGTGLLAAGVVLAVMAVPYLTAVGFRVCRAVPRPQRDAALALGATRWQTVLRVVLPYAKRGFVAAGFLALGRALGETMAVTMLVGSRADIDFSFFALGDTIPSRIANQLNDTPDPLGRSAIAALGLVLFVATAAFNAAGRLILNRLERAAAPAAEPAVPGAFDPPALPPAPPGPAAAHHPKFWNAAMTAVLAGCFGLVVLPLFLILVAVVGTGAAGLTPEFVLNRPHPPGSGKPSGLGHALAGSALTVLLAAAVAVPWGLLAAAYLSEKRTTAAANAVRFAADLLAGVPAILVGATIYAVLVQPSWGFGFSAAAGAAALALIIVPIVVRVGEEAMRQVPDDWRAASMALGATKPQTAWRVVLPAALPGVLTAGFLAVGRASGETAPLLLTAGGSRFWPLGPFDPVATVPAAVYADAFSPYPDRVAQAWAAALVLLAAVLLLNLGVRLLRRGDRGA